MSNLPQIFNYNDFQVRTVVNDAGEVWFCGQDVCRALEIKNNRDAISFLNDNQKAVVNHDTLGGSQNMIFISESGLYKLTFRSRKKEAEKFQDWITEEVLPTIRKTGSYSVQETYKLPQNFAEALRLLASEVEEKEKLLIENAEMKPKVEMFDLMLSGGNCQTMNEVAKVLGYGRNKLFALLREKSILMKNNLPYQKYIDSDYFDIREVSIQRGDNIMNVTQTMVTAKGIGFIGKILKEGF